MQYYFAPMEGLTDATYRQLHSKYFKGIDRYYTPFFSPTEHRNLTPKERRELPAANTLNYICVPQVLTKVPGNFIWMAHVAKDLGYEEINLNLGCPSGTVTAKGKGSGMLRDLGELDQFLNQIFADSPLPISIKTRIGFDSAEEFPAIMEVLNRYPLSQLIIHPRIRSQFYKGDVNMDAFEYALSSTKFPLCYNGNLHSKNDASKFFQKYPQVHSVMIGRSLIGDPGMLSNNGNNIEILAAFMDELLEVYTDVFGGPRNAMFRMKENWRHLLCKFENSEKLGKRLRKTTDLLEFKDITRQIFTTLPIRENLQPDW